MKKKNKSQVVGESTTDLVDDNIQKPEKGKKKLSKIKLLSILWTTLMFCVYIVLDAIKIVKNGWTPVNIIVTVFLGLQIILFAVFTLIGSKNKQQTQRQKATLKYVKKTKKLTLKLTTVVTSILMIIGVEKVSFSDVLAIVVAVISLIGVLISLLMSIRRQVKKANKKKAKQEKNKTKEN